MGHAAADPERGARSLPEGRPFRILHARGRRPRRPQRHGALSPFRRRDALLASLLVRRSTFEATSAVRSQERPRSSAYTSPASRTSISRSITRATTSSCSSRTAELGYKRIFKGDRRAVRGSSSSWWSASSCMKSKVFDAARPARGGALHLVDVDGIVSLWLLGQLRESMDERAFRAASRAHAAPDRGQGSAPVTSLAASEAPARSLFLYLKLTLQTWPDSVERAGQKESEENMTDVISGDRTTAVRDEGVVVFLIGMRINSWWKVTAGCPWRSRCRGSVRACEAAGLGYSAPSPEASSWCGHWESTEAPRLCG